MLVRDQYTGKFHPSPIFSYVEEINLPVGSLALKAEFTLTSILLTQAGPDSVDIHAPSPTTLLSQIILEKKLHNVKDTEPYLSNGKINSSCNVQHYV